MYDNKKQKEILSGPEQKELMLRNCEESSRTLNKAISNYVSISSLLIIPNLH